MDQGSSRHRYACFHEAGHCLGWWYFGMPIEHAYVPTADQLIVDGIVNRLGFDIVEGGRVVVDASAIISSDHLPIIGPDRFAGNALVFENMSVITCMMGSFAQARFEDIDVSLLPTHHSAIDERAIANILQRYSDANKLVARLGAEIRAKALVMSEKGWRGITLIAHELEHRGTIQGSEIRQILSSVYGVDAEPGCWFGREMPDPPEIADGKIYPALSWVRDIVRL